MIRDELAKLRQEIIRAVPGIPVFQAYQRDMERPLGNYITFLKVSSRLTKRARFDNQNLMLSTYISSVQVDCFGNGHQENAERLKAYFNSFLSAKSGIISAGNIRLLYSNDNQGGYGDARASFDVKIEYIRQDKVVIQSAFSLTANPVIAGSENC